MSRRSTVAQSKQAERDVAKLLGGRRLTAGEWHGKGDVDVLGPGWAAQVKHRSGVPDYIIEGMRQIQEATDKQGYLLPLLVLLTKPGRGKPARAFVIMEADDWYRLFESGNK